nr:aminotransferase class III-fold pyridoxal phosphate-dependent enzyme [Methyloprofundus sedimenti]
MTQERDIPLIIDEVQTCLGRTGSMYAYEQAGIVPDVLVLSKAIGGGLPMSVVVYNKSLDEWQPGAHAGTFRGNQLAMAAGTATIDYIRTYRLDLHADKMGKRLMAMLRKTQIAHPHIGDVRGRGLMIGVEIVNTDLSSNTLGAYPADRELASQIQAECLRRGLIVELGGRKGSVVRFLPPLIITSDEVDQVGQIFNDALNALTYG